LSSIGVVWKRHGNREPASLLDLIQDAQADCGPDRSDVWADSEIAFGCNLLILLPEDTFDRQPLWSADGRCCLVADVPLDNRGELVRELGLRQPELMADSNVLLAAWLRWEHRCLDHIVGSFAFAVWTPEEAGV